MIEHKETVNKNTDETVISGQVFGDPDTYAMLYFWNQIIMNNNKPSYSMYFRIGSFKPLFFSSITKLNFLIYLKTRNGIELIQNYSASGEWPTVALNDKSDLLYVPVSKIENNQISLSISTYLGVKNLFSKDYIPINNKMRFLIRLDKNPEKYKNTLTLKNYFTQFMKFAGEPIESKGTTDLLDVVINYDPQYFEKRLDFDLKINYRYIRSNENEWTLPPDIIIAINNILNKLNTPDDLTVFDVILDSQKDYKIKKIKDKITESEDSFLIKTTTKTKLDSKIRVVTDDLLGDEGIVKNFLGKEKAIFSRYVSFNGIEFIVDSSGQERGFDYKIVSPKEMTLDNFLEYQVNYLKDDWDKVSNIKVDIEKGINFI